MDSIAPHPCDMQPGVPAPVPTSVYRYYDSIGVLIYVGITRQGMGRNAQHNGKAEWWPLVARQEVEHLPTRGAAEIREKQLIRQHRPPFNKQHNPDHGEMRAAYLEYAGTYSAQMHSPRDLYLQLGKRLPVDILSYEPGQLVLRTRLAEGPLAAVLQKGPGELAVRGRRRRYGLVQSLEVAGPTVLITCFMRSSKKTRPPEGGISKAEVVMGWAQDKKPNYPYIQRVEVVEGDIVEAESSGYRIRRYGDDTLILPKVSA